MGVTRLKRKDRKNKVVSVLKKQHRKLQTGITNILSPNKGESGVIIEE
ncbi:MAG TPA: spore protein [Bacteroidia bacterium]|nr:spore protein [Bacteroidia bacterium]